MPLPSKLAVDTLFSQFSLNSNKIKMDFNFIFDEDFFAAQLGEIKWEGFIKFMEFQSS